ncbi:MAG: FAD-dependent oxidoreductase [Cyanobacteria bacterium]|nr:FAD-dependent oxidoreductase [Cyanobacteria bacterium bin.51]
MVVWGGGSGGVAAALQAARSGASTLLLTPGSWLGGMVSAAGVCAPDGNELSPWQTGLWGALLRQLQQEEPEGLDQNWVSCFGWRPATAESILRRWLAAEPRARWWSDCRLRDVERQGSRLLALTVERGGQMVRLPLVVLIDGSDRGDLLPSAGVPFRLGWEARQEWDEPSAPTRERLEAEPFFQRQQLQSPTWVVMGQLGEGRCPDGRRLAAPFEQASSHFGLERTVTYGRLPGGQVMLNWPLHGNDWHGDLSGAFSGDAVAESNLYGQMRAHSLAFAAACVEATEGWMQLGSVFPEAGDPATTGSSALALMPYWREGRRLVGQITVKEQDLLPSGPGVSIAHLPFDGASSGSHQAVQSIAVGNYANDHHYPGADWPLAPKSCRWGGRWSGTPFCIPYGALVSASVDNLLTSDKCFSSSHMANGATRLQPLILNIGQAAGAAAALAVRLGVPPVALPLRQLQQALINDPKAPASPLPLWDTPWHHPDRARRQHAALDDPGLISAAGGWCGPAGSAAMAPPQEAQAQRFSGRLHPDGDGGYRLDTDSGRWPVITLEPDLASWLEAQQSPCQVALIAVANPWGPWLRASRLAD